MHLIKRCNTSAARFPRSPVRRGEDGPDPKSQNATCGQSRMQAWPWEDNRRLADFMIELEEASYAMQISSTCRIESSSFQHLSCPWILSIPTSFVRRICEACVTCGQSNRRPNQEDPSSGIGLVKRINI